MEAATEEGCSRVPRVPRVPHVGAASPSSQSTRSRLQDLTFTGGMNHVRPQNQGATRPCAYEKHKKIRPPMMNVGDELGARDMPCARSVVGSAVSSQRSSVYKAAVLETQAETQAETQRAFAGLASTRAECNEQHQAITSNTVEVRQFVQEGLQISDQLRTAQSQQNVRVEAMGHRLEMNDLLLQRELRVATQIYDLSTQMNSVLHAIDVLRREQSLPRSSEEGMKTGIFAASNVAKPVKSPSVGLYIKPSLPERDKVEAPKPSSSKFPKLTPNPEVTVEQPIPVMPDSERKPARVQIKGPHDSSSAVQSATILVVQRTRAWTLSPPFTSIRPLKLICPTPKPLKGLKLTKPHIYHCYRCHLGQAPRT